ncbi:hypothetical protein CCR97_14455 [Rhodoplanes elegans]|uniref:Uncharacterized protein n=1 Tax=Rhodoplanes elegans TaxID=29408 RepID=A0A327K7S0_9BRAD|nr:hypothetical protein [Rhodoplanes elegans]MBK5959399.1 hypothetical protein [Rhodoplanes elegans]RAI33964.1 hypothetical protein CH338_21710 [Rhodoplanes elegans]
MATPYLGPDDSRFDRSPVGAVVSTAGVMIRYGFYLVGLLVLGLIGLVILWVSSFQVTRSDDQPSFRLADPSLERLGGRGLVATSRGIGRVEIRQYGNVLARDQDLTVALVQAPSNWFGETDFRGEMRTMPVARQFSGQFGRNHWDLETRYGDLRAVDATFFSDGLRKPCFVFLSRFSTTAVYLKGWYCEADGSRPSAARLACLIDRLVLDRALPAKDADAFLRARMVNSPRCSASPLVQTTDPRGPNPAVARKASPYAPPRNY